MVPPRWCDEQGRPLPPPLARDDPRLGAAAGSGRGQRAALWKEPEVFYAVGDRTRCDQVRAGLGTPTEECWGPVYFRRE